MRLRMLTVQGFRAETRSATAPRPQRAWLEPGFRSRKNLRVLPILHDLDRPRVRLSRGAGDGSLATERASAAQEPRRYIPGKD